VSRRLHRIVGSCRETGVAEVLLECGHTLRVAGRACVAQPPQQRVARARGADGQGPRRPAAASAQPAGRTCSNFRPSCVSSSLRRGEALASTMRCWFRAARWGKIMAAAPGSRAAGACGGVGARIACPGRSLIWSLRHPGSPPGAHRPGPRGTQGRRQL
jgi:hypothetical protein